GVVEQGQARLKVFLLAASSGTIFDHDALRDAGRLVDLFDQRLGIDQVLILHDTVLFRDQRHGERIPFGDPVALLHLFAVLVHDRRALRQLVGRTLAALAVDDRDFARTRQRQAATALVDNRRHVAIFDRAVRDGLEVRLLVDLRRAADVEGPHRQLRAGLTDRLGGDDAHGLADVHRRAACKVAAVAFGADPHRRFADERAADLDGLNFGFLD